MQALHMLAWRRSSRFREMAEQDRGWSPILGWTGVEIVVTAGRRGRRRIGAEDIDVTGKLPDLLRR